MKHFLYFIPIVIFTTACSSSSKHLDKGHYETALKKAALKLRKKPNKYQEVDVFNTAYAKLHQKDSDAIVRLKQQGNPENWSKIHQLYSKMDKRQELALSLPAEGINIPEKKFYKEMEEAKNNATAYAYAKGEELLSHHNRFDAREAHKRFMEVKSYNKHYKSVNQRIEEAIAMGTTNVFFTVKENARVVMPVELQEALQHIYVDDMDAPWINYDNMIDTALVYHYSIVLELKNIVISPEQLKEQKSTQTKEVEDGFEYELDANGNVKKDSLGNDIKHTKYKTIRCDVRRFHQLKNVHMNGFLTYFDNAKNKHLKREPIAADAVFEHFYATANGNLNALDNETRNELNLEPVPFPSNAQLMLQAGDVLKGVTKNIISNNKGIIR